MRPKLMHDAEEERIATLEEARQKEEETRRRNEEAEANREEEQRMTALAARKGKARGGRARQALHNT
jgi:hypothetical protein